MNSPIVATPPAAESVSLAARERLLELYGRSLYVQAWEAAKEHAPLDAWTGTESRVLAARLLHNLGGVRRSSAWILRAFRADPGNPTASYFGHRALLYSRGPLVAWQSMERSPLAEDAEVGLRADWHALAARLLGGLRDFAPAERWMQQALELDPQRAWLYVEQSGLLMLQDRQADAISALRHALELRPWYRPAVQSLASVLVLQNDTDEAEALLGEATERLESCHVVGQLAQIQLELGKHQQARETWKAYEPLAPHLEEKGRTWLRGNLCNAAYLCGDLEAAVELGQEAGEWHEQVSRNTAYDPDGRRAMLEVGFIRQHHRTCGPASLTMVCDYWNMRVDHLELADEICYDGTTNLSERRWAEKDGWIVREFTVCWDDTVALIDRGVPFTLCTTEPTNAHLQIVMGYDERRGTLLVRDPTFRQFQEFLADRAFQRYRSTGPRGMALVPAAEAHRLEGLRLCDEDLYDKVYRMEGALHDHDRAEAERAFQELAAVAPGARLTLASERNLGLYDMDTARTLAATDALLGLFPECGIFELRKLGLLERLGRREELMALLKEASEREGADPVFRERYASELLSDARQHERARYLLRRAMRRRPTAAGNLRTLADLLGEQRRFDEALPLYRFAACLEHKQEGFARSYFSAARYAGDVSAGLEFLQDRVQRYGRQSGLPVQTLVWACGVLDRTQEGLAALEDALEQRPDDGELLLFAAEEYSRGGELERGRQLIATAEGKVPRNTWLRCAAQLARLDARPQDALAYWQEIIAADPLSVDAHGELGRVLVKVEGRAAGIEHLEAAARENPRSQGLLKLLIAWYGESEEEQLEAAIRQVISNNPLDPWAHRELAVCLGDQRRFEEAHAALDEALRLDPHSCAAYGILGDLHRKAGELEEARAAFQQALLFDIDYSFAIARLVRCCETAADRKQALAFVREELGQQRVYGSSLMALYEEWRGVGDPEEMLVVLRESHAKYSERWEAWSALVGQLGDMERLDEALEIAEGALERFPFKAQVRRDLAWVHRLRGDDAAEVSTLERLLVVDPADRSTARTLAMAHLRKGRQAEARTLLEAEVARAPFDAELHSLLARIRWEAGDREGALEQLERALRIEPQGSGAPWGRLANWAQSQGDPERSLRLARELAEAQPKNAAAWLRLARMVPLERTDESLAALDRALEIDPYDANSHDLRAELLCERGEHERALVACTPEVYGGSVPLILRGRRAWVLAESGDRPAAIAAMRSILEGAPTYFWGWQKLSDWCRATGDHEGHLAAARSLARLAPHDDLALAHLGSGLLRAGDREGAKATFTRALELAPDAFAAGIQLSDLLLEDGEHDAALPVLTRLRDAYPDDEDVWRRISDLAVARGEQAEALDAIRRLCRIRCEDGGPFQHAAERVAKNGWVAPLIEVFEEALGEEAVHRDLGRAWVDAMDYSGRLLECESRIETLSGPVQHEALTDYLESLAVSEELGERRRRKELKRFVRANEPRLRADDELWGAVAYALSVAGDHAGTREWLHDWRERKEAVRPWVLNNLCVSLFRLKRDDECLAVGQAALELTPDHATNHHKVRVGLELALRGRTDSAREALSGLGETEFGPTITFLHGLALAVLKGAEDDPAARGKAREILRAVVAGYEGGFWPEPHLRRAYLRSAWSLAHGALGVLWFLWLWLWWTVSSGRG